METKSSCKADKQADYPPSAKFDPCHGNYFVTSTGIGHRYIPHPGMAKGFFSFKIPEEEGQRGVLIKEFKKQTTCTNSYRWHFNETECEKIVRMHNSKVQYVKRFGEGMKTNPPKQFQISKTEYQQKYPYNSVYPSNTNCVNLSPHVSCKVAAYDKDLRPTLTPESGGSARYLDPYNSTSHLDYHAYDPGLLTTWLTNDIEKYKGIAAVPTFQLSTRIKPVYDNLVFNTKYIEKVLPKVIHHVPHAGLESEMKGKYRLPNDETSLNSQRRKPCGFPAVTRSPQTDTLLVPYMYNTEYDKIGKPVYVCGSV